MQIVNNRRFCIRKKKCVIDKIYLCVKDPYEAKYQYLINKREKLGLKHFDDLLLSTQMIWKMFIKILIIFDDMIADMTSNKKLNPIVTELFIRGRNLNISIFFKQSYFKVPKKG